MSQHLLNLPHEVLHRILINVDPQDLGRLCCCRTLSSFIKSDRLLWKELYLRSFVGTLSQTRRQAIRKATDDSKDDPRSQATLKPNMKEPLWAIKLQELTKLQKILESEDAVLKVLIT